MDIVDGRHIALTVMSLRPAALFTLMIMTLTQIAMCTYFKLARYYQ